MKRCRIPRWLAVSALPLRSACAQAITVAVRASLSRTTRLGLILATLLGAVSAPAFVIFWRISSTGLPLKWAVGNVPLRIMLGDSLTLSDGTNYNTSAQAAAQTWSSKLGAIVFTTTFAPAGETGERNGISEVFFSSTLFGREFPDAVALTASMSGSNPNREADIIFNTEHRFDSYRGPLRSADGEWVYDLHRVMLHELGHALGLGHPSEAGQQVIAKMNPGAHELDALQDDDITGGQALYGPPGAPPNDAFASATEITLSGDTTVINGYNTNATREAGEPLVMVDPGGRSVWWRWTAPTSDRLILTTTGSYFDTMAVAFAGTSLTALEPIVANHNNAAENTRTSALTFNATAGRVYHFSVDGENGDSGGIVLNLRLAQDSGSPPTIITQPQSVTVNAGEQAQFTVGSGGTHPHSYQWHFNGEPLAGRTLGLLSILRAETTHAGNYSVVVTNKAGSITSNTVTLTVNAPPPPPSPPPSSGGGGGGGGAPSLWFVTVLAALVLARACTTRSARNM